MAIEENRGSLRSFLTSIASVKGDLSNITAPPFVLASKSAVEFPASWAENPAVLCAPAHVDDPAERARLVVKWYLASLKRQQYSSGSEADGAKKPLNAFLGELFVGSFLDDGEGGTGETRLVSEQVSHHPPVTACYLWNSKNGVRGEGYSNQVITMEKASMSIKIEQTGHSITHYDKFQEAHLATLPTLSIKGLLSGGKPYPELSGSSYITSSTGFTTRIDYEGKGFFGGGQKNGFKAKMYQTTDPSNVLFEVSGAWNDKFTFYDVRNGGRKEIETYDTSKQKEVPMSINSLEEQDPWESRRAWQHVIAAVEANDWGRTDKEKTKVEEAQRELRRQRQKSGDQWEPALFSTVPSDPVFEALAKGISYEEDVKKTVGIWKFDLEKAGQAERPYHGNLKPDLS